jgi:hypothetical protein
MGRVRLSRLIERSAIVITALAISIGVIALLSGGLLAGHDDPGVSGSSSLIGVQFPDQGATHLAPGTLQPVYDSDPPTSGPHVPEPVLHDQSPLNDYQLLQALEVGDVVIMYGSSRPPKALQSLADSIAAPFTPALAAAGQAVILAPLPGLRALIGLAWTRAIQVSSADSASLRSFTLYWLGRGGD